MRATNSCPACRNYRATRVQIQEYFPRKTMHRRGRSAKKTADARRQERQQREVLRRQGNLGRREREGEESKPFQERTRTALSVSVPLSSPLLPSAALPPALSRLHLVQGLPVGLGAPFRTIDQLSAR